MSKITQKDLLQEGFWDNFSKTSVGRNVNKAIEAGKQISSIVAPEIHDPIKKGVDKFRDVRASIAEAGKTIEEKIERWVKEQGNFAISEPKKIATYPDGKIHYSVRIAEKGVSVLDNSEVAGRIYRNPSAVVGYNPRDKQFSWVNKPRTDSYVKYKGTDGHMYYKYHDPNADGVDERVDPVQQAPTAPASSKP
jgi:hypothetical protein